MALFAGLPVGNKSASAPVTTGLDSLEDLVVARIGDHIISGREFLTSYKVGPAFVKRKNRENPRLAHLDLMVLEKIMAIEGKETGALSKPDIQILLEEIRQDLAVQRMYEADILPQATVSDAELAHAVDADQVQVWFRYASVPSEEAGEMLIKEIEAGALFDSLSVASHNPVNQDPLTFWGVEQQDAEFARQLAGLEIGTLSGIIKTTHGLFVARVDRVFRDPLTTPTQQSEKRRKLEKQLRQLKADSIAYEYAASRMEAVQPVIKRAAFNELFSFFEQLSDQATRNPDNALMGNWPGSVDRSSMTEVAPDTLLATAGGGYTITQFLDWYDLRRFPVEGKTPAARANQLKSIIWRMLRDRLLGDEAVNRGFADNQLVESELSWWRDKFTYWEVREALLAEVSPSEADVAEVMAIYPHRYTTGTQQQIQKDAFLDAYTLQERSILMRYFNEHRQTLSIEVDTFALQSLPIATDHLARPIELLALRKEGTFPRIAYPTIDRVWERY